MNPVSRLNEDTHQIFPDLAFFFSSTQYVRETLRTVYGPCLSELIHVYETFVWQKWTNLGISQTYLWPGVYSLSRGMWVWVGSVWEHRVWGVGDGRRAVYGQGLIQGTAACILIRTNLDKLATAVNTWAPPSSYENNRKNAGNGKPAEACVCLFVQQSNT